MTDVHQCHGCLYQPPVKKTDVSAWLKIFGTVVALAIGAATIFVGVGNRQWLAKERETDLATMAQRIKTVEDDSKALQATVTTIDHNVRKLGTKFNVAMDP